MNSVTMIGRLSKDPVKRMTQTKKPVTSFSIAVNRDKEHADFFECVAWNGTAELVDKYFHKGDQIGITGRLQTQSWKDKDGKNRKTVEIIVNTVDFIGSRKQETDPGFDDPDLVFEELDDDDGELPF